MRPYSCHLKPGWTRETLSRAIHRAIFTLNTEELLKEQRERVYVRWEALRKILGPGKTDAYVNAGEAAGHPAMYDVMTEEDCTYWLTLEVPEDAH